MIDFKEHKISSPRGLMLDNLLYDRHGEVTSLRPRSFHAWDHPDMGGNYGFYAIPLAKEWLLRFGFEWDEIAYSINSFILAPTRSGKRFDVYPNGLSNGCATTVDFVHELQNVYFCLLGSEIIPKETSSNLNELDK